MKRWLIIFAALVPLSGMANTLNSTNDPNKPGYNPSQQRMQQKMQTNQQQQMLKLKQDQQRQSQDQQRKVQEQRDSAQQRIIKTQPGSNSSSQQP
ncbi:DUF2756 domain-containing protein [Erwiniaceae bacterium BAC15a-03b]|uniref:DUF2756 domain-containing protein n=1 Tax=Winslowiella arboricola TaxID=2978220 RepID=A0A9J6PJJ5_9GAMM|nr:DUF2756 domain-containing protein [Winslowiella arboricola]MCU5771223.1 DUF2756 domain-containing protein [Winslowiella arboricola]MCU5777530.1 DUF2756 domain-containing protein [Winslowiella arboricola]